MAFKYCLGRNSDYKKMFDSQIAGIDIYIMKEMKILLQKQSNFLKKFKKTHLK